MNVVIREATAADAEQVLAMLRALARYVEHEHWLEADAASVARDGFGAGAAFHTLLALRGGAEAVGFATWYGIYSTFGACRLLYIEDLFVTQACRGHGIGSRLLAQLAALAKSRGFGGMALSVLQWNPAREIYERAGFEETSDWLPYRVTGEPFDRLAARAAPVPQTPHRDS